MNTSQNNSAQNSETTQASTSLNSQPASITHLPEDYPIHNRDDFFVVICKTDAFMPMAYYGQILLMRKNHFAEVGDIVMVNADHLSPRLEFCTVEGVYPAGCVAAKPQLLEILPDGTVSKAA